VDESLELKKKISQLPDDELLEMVTINASEYREQAVAFAKVELTARGIDFTKVIEEPEAGLDAGKDSPSMLDSHGVIRACLMCGGELRHGTLVAERELSIIFEDNKEERLVIANACSKCGQVSFTLG
jgi:hypothetical protein